MTGINLSEPKLKSDIKTENCPKSKCTTLKNSGGRPKQLRQQSAKLLEDMSSFL